MSNTTQLESTLVQLESLYTAYNELLASAKQQLATLEVDESNLKRISEICLTDRSFRSYIKEQINDQIIALIQESVSSDFVIELIDQRVTTLFEQTEIVHDAAAIHNAAATIFTTIAKNVVVEEK